MNTYREGIVVQALHRDTAETIRATLADPELPDRSRERAATLSRRAAELLRADCPTFSYEWFFGACGLDSWGERMTDPGTRR